jgi:hypothetical protein
MKISRSIFINSGVFPVTDHYYDPFVRPDMINSSLREDRDLKGIDFNTAGQIELLTELEYKTEIRQLELDTILDRKEGYPYFLPSEAEYYYSMIRHFKPGKIVEIGSGISSKIAMKAIEMNRKIDSVNTELVCIEPYENPWLESIGASIIRKKVEDVPPDFFASLNENDILFIDSSHVIRPQGDVLFEYFNILPVLKKGVIIHIHDIFTPKYYPSDWIVSQFTFWNEQYLVEAFLSFNDSYRITGALNYLKHHHFDRLSDCLESLKGFPEQEPASMWLRKVK